MAVRSADPSPSTCSCPTSSSSDRGRIRTAKGASAATSSAVDPASLSNRRAPITDEYEGVGGGLDDASRSGPGRVIPVAKRHQIPPPKAVVGTRRDRPRLPPHHLQSTPMEIATQPQAAQSTLESFN